MEEKLNFQEINSIRRINFLNKNHLWLSYVCHNSESLMLLGKNNSNCISWRILMTSIFPKWKLTSMWKKAWMRIFSWFLVQIGIWGLDRKGLEHKFLQPVLSVMIQTCLQSIGDLWKGLLLLYLCPCWKLNGPVIIKYNYNVTVMLYKGVHTRPSVVV